MAKTATLSESFGTGSYNGSFVGTGNLSTAGNRLEVQYIAGSANYSNITSLAFYDLTNSYIQIEVIDAGNQALVSFEAYPIFAYADVNNSVFWIITNGGLAAYKRVGAVNTLITTTAFVLATHKFLRIREDGGVVYFDYSPDSVTWTNLTTELVSNLFDITSVKIRIEAGAYAAEVSGTFLQVDNLNVTKKGISRTFFKNVRPAIFTPGRAR